MNDLEKNKKKKPKILKKFRRGEEANTRMEPNFRHKISLNDIKILIEEDNDDLGEDFQDEQN